VAEYYVQSELGLSLKAERIRCQSDGKLCEVSFPRSITIAVSLARIPTYVIAHQIPTTRAAAPRREYTYRCTRWGQVTLLPDLTRETVQKQVLRELEQIRDDFRKRDARFKQQIEAELQLRNEMIKTTGSLGPQKLKPFLLEPLLSGNPSNFSSFGSNFAQKMLPPKLAQRIMHSEASLVHFSMLGRFLQRYAEVLQSKDAAFKQRVEQERKSSQRLKEKQTRR
jgi:hypothetical protein